MFDVRSPGEFAQGHIPGAHNLPLFDNEERAVIGKLYKQVGRSEALKKGLEFVGPKMRPFVEKAEALANGNGALAHCWRGGMRSASFAWLLETAGIATRVLNGGYKAYRNFVLELFQQSYPLVVLGGFTGSGKTEVLYELRALGEQVIDLEGLANHKGSAFGHLGEADQPTGEQFENDLGFKLHHLDRNRPVWVEDESRHIGSRILPKLFYASMREAPVIRMEIPRKARINRLVDDYGPYERQSLRHSVQKIEKRLGGLRTQQALQALEDDDLALVADITLEYYDKAYQHGLNKRNEELVKTISLEGADAAVNARKIQEQSRSWIAQKLTRN